jgi:hypothetical protein
MSGVVQRGLIVGNWQVLADLPKAAFKVISWDNSRSPKTRQATFDALRAEGLIGESVFDAAHGRRYILFVYADAAGRAACWDFLTSPAR